MTADDIISLNMKNSSKDIDDDPVSWKSKASLSCAGVRIDYL